MKTAEEIKYLEFMEVWERAKPLSDALSKNFIIDISNMNPSLITEIQIDYSISNRSDDKTSQTDFPYNLDNIENENI